MGYVHYIRHPRGQLYPIDSEKFDMAFLSLHRSTNLQLGECGVKFTEFFDLHQRSMLAEGSCDYGTELISRTLKILKFTEFGMSIS